jgi:hypothetical protein
MEEAIKTIASQGIIGVVCLLLLYALKRIFDLYVASQEKRIGEAVDNRAAIERNTAAMTALTDVVKDRAKS